MFYIQVTIRVDNLNQNYLIRDLLNWLLLFLLVSFFHKPCILQIISHDKLKYFESKMFFLLLKHCRWLQLHQCNAYSILSLKFPNEIRNLVQMGYLFYRPQIKAKERNTVKPALVTTSIKNNLYYVTLISISLHSAFHLNMYLATTPQKARKRYAIIL